VNRWDPQITVFGGIVHARAVDSVLEHREGGKYIATLKIKQK
jgi:hypothetical protein